MVHEHHDAALSGLRVESSGYGQYQLEMGIVRAHIVQFDPKKASFACRGA